MSIATIAVVIAAFSFAGALLYGAYQLTSSDI
jgi:hypothetical protein